MFDWSAMLSQSRCQVIISVSYHIGWIWCQVVNGLDDVDMPLKFSSILVTSGKAKLEALQIRLENSYINFKRSYADI